MKILGKQYLETRDEWLKKKRIGRNKWYPTKKCITGECYGNRLMVPTLPVYPVYWGLCMLTNAWFNDMCQVNMAWTIPKKCNLAIIPIPLLGIYIHVSGVRSNQICSEFHMRDSQRLINKSADNQTNVTEANMPHTQNHFDQEISSLKYDNVINSVRNSFNNNLSLTEFHIANGLVNIDGCLII